MAVGVAFSFRIQATPDYREGLVAAGRPLSLDPLIARGDPAARDVGRLLYRGLLRFDGQTRPVPDLARSLEISSDGLTYTLALPDAMQWSDGHPLTATDIAATVAFVQTPNLADPVAATPWRGVRIDLGVPGSVRFILPSPRASFAATLAELPILPLGRLDSGDLLGLPARAREPMPTSGPYRVLSSTAASLRLEANPYSPEHPQLARLELRLLPDFEAAVRELAAGDVDAVAGTTPAEQARLAALPRVRLRRLVSYRFVDLVLNERTPGLDDVAVRRALSLAVDRQSLVDQAVRGAGQPQARAVPVGIRWAGDAHAPGPDLSAARGVLDAAGWALGPDGVRVRGATRLAYRLDVADSAPLPEVARSVAAQLLPLGVGLTVRTVPAASFEQGVLTPDAFSIALADWDSGPDPDLSSFWRSNATPPNGFNLSGGQPDPFLDRALDTLATATEEGARREAADRVQSLIADAAPAVFLYAPAEGVAIGGSVTNAPLPDSGGAGARFTLIGSWSRGEPRGEARNEITVLLTAAGIVVGLAAVLFTGSRLAGWLCPPGSASALERTLVALLLDVVQVIAVLQVLGALHLLWPVAVLTVHVIVAAAVVARVPPPEVEPGERMPPGLGWAAVIAAAIPFSAWAVVQDLSGPSGEHETRRFHVVNAAHWLQAHTTWSLPFAAPGDATTATAAGNSDLLALWAMLPTHTDELACLGNLVLAVICVLSTAMIVRDVGASAWKGAMAGVLVVTTPLVMLTQTRSLLPDLAVSAGLLSAIAMVLRGRLYPDSPAWPALGGLGLGLAVGSDALAALPAAAVALWAVVVLRRQRLRGALLLAGGSAALAGFWFLRNWVMTGDPIYPWPVRLGGAVLVNGGPDILAVRSTSLLAQVLSLHLDAVGRWALAAGELYGLGMLVLLALVLPVSIAVLARRRPGALTIALLVPVLGIVYLLTPGTGGGPGGELPLLAGGLLWSLPAVLLAAAVCASLVPRRAWLIMAAAVLLYNAVIAVQSPTRPDLQVNPQLLVAVAAVAGALLLAALTAGTLLSASSGLVRWQAAVCGGAAVIIAGGGLAGLLRFTEPPPLSPVSRVLAQSGRPDGRVVVLHDADVRSILGGRLDVDILPAGRGAPGSQSALDDANELTQRLQELSPAVIVVGTDGVDPLPPGWRPPASWRQVATLDRGARVYVP